MDIEEELVICKCECGNEIRINKVWYPAGCNDYGSFVVKCEKCGKVFEIGVGRDVDASDIISGAELIEKKYRD